jgi:hypothetical protein
MVQMLENAANERRCRGASNSGSKMANGVHAPPEFSAGVDRMKLEKAANLLSLGCASQDIVSTAVLGCQRSVAV